MTLSDALRLGYQLFALAGATLIFCEGSLFARVRRLWPKLLGCPQCVGFWVGLGAALVLDRAGPWPRALGAAFLSGCATSLASLLASALLVRLLGPLEDKE